MQVCHIVFMATRSLTTKAGVFVTEGADLFGIFRANADGTGFAAVDSSNDMNWYAVKVDNVAVYFYHSGAIIRRLR